MNYIYNNKLSTFVQTDLSNSILKYPCHKFTQRSKPKILLHVFAPNLRFHNFFKYSNAQKVYFYFLGMFVFVVNCFCNHFFLFKFSISSLQLTILIKLLRRHISISSHFLYSGTTVPFWLRSIWILHAINPTLKNIYL